VEVDQLAPNWFKISTGCRGIVRNTFFLGESEGACLLKGGRREKKDQFRHVGPRMSCISKTPHEQRGGGGIWHEFPGLFGKRRQEKQKSK